MPNKLGFPGNFCCQKYKNVHIQYYIDIIFFNMKFNLFKYQTYLGTNQGVIRKEKSKGFLNII